MSSFLSEEDTQAFKQRGYIVIKGIITKPHRIARSIIKEVKQIVFTSDEDQASLSKLEKKEIDPLLLLVDAKLREKYLDEPKSVWFNNNIRTPKIAKNNGIANIYHNERVRDKILFNEDIYNAICTLYSLLTGKQEDCIYLYGPDRVCVKPQGATHMPKHIDCNIACYEEDEETKSVQNNPLSMFRIQTVTCLQIDPETKNNGRTEILSGYNNYFLLGAYYFRKMFSSEYKIGILFTPVIVQEVFAKNLPEFLEYVDSFYKKGKLLPKEKTPLKKERDLYERIYASLPKRKIEIAWVQPNVTPGDILCFDQRLPHRNTKNDSPIARVASFVSLYPKSYLQEGDETPYDLFKGKAKKVRTFDARGLEKQCFKDEWKERVAFEVTPLIARMLNLEKDTY